MVLCFYQSLRHTPITLREASLQGIDGFLILLNFFSWTSDVKSNLNLPYINGNLHKAMILTSVTFFFPLNFLSVEK